MQNGKLNSLAVPPTNTFSTDASVHAVIVNANSMADDKYALVIRRIIAHLPRRETQCYTVTSQCSKENALLVNGHVTPPNVLSMGCKHSNAEMMARRARLLFEALCLGDMCVSREASLLST